MLEYYIELRDNSHDTDDIIKLHSSQVDLMNYNNNDRIAEYYILAICDQNDNVIEELAYADKDDMNEYTSANNLQIVNEELIEIEKYITRDMGACKEMIPCTCDVWISYCVSN